MRWRILASVSEASQFGTTLSSVILMIKMSSLYVMCKMRPRYNKEVNSPKVVSSSKYRGNELIPVLEIASRGATVFWGCRSARGKVRQGQTVLQFIQQESGLE